MHFNAFNLSCTYLNSMTRKIKENNTAHASKHTAKFAKFMRPYKKIYQKS